MNIKALITTLILGSSSVAMARPVTVSGHAEATWSYGNTGPTVRDHRYPEPVVVQPAPTTRYDRYARYDRDSRYGRHGWRKPRWGNHYYAATPLASGLGFSAPDDRAFISVGAHKGTFNSLRIDAAGGRTLIKQVYIDFGGGQEQVIRNINRTLVGNESLMLDLNGNSRPINRIVVYGESQSFGWRNDGAAFNVSAL